MADIWGPTADLDPGIKALSFAIQQALARLQAAADTAGVYYAIDTLQEAALDNLAVELGAMYYDQSLGIDVKRELVKNTLKWYSTAGTPTAVLELVMAVFGNGDVREWFDVDANPGEFDINTSATITGDALEEINRIIRKIKNVRSHLRRVNVTREMEAPMFLGSVVRTHYRFTLRDGGLPNA